MTDLIINGTSLTHEAFNPLFTEDKPIHFNFYGYPIKFTLWPIQGRVSISGSIIYLLCLTINADTFLQIHGRRHHYLTVRCMCLSLPFYVYSQDDAL